MTDLIGSQLGNYRLVRLLGKGGFADVYLGEHIHLNTRAAIKVLQTRLIGNDVEQFRNEARLIAHLKHPNIIPILDFGVERDVPFLVMDYAENGALRQRYPQGIPLAPTVVLPYVIQVAAALQYAHNQRLIHRDIKPENMLLGRSGEVLLSDFGLAMITESTRAQGMSGQRTVDAAGTIYYMAPEQIQGHPIAASDQYALGVVLYEWLSGVRPFHGSSYVEIAMLHLSAPPPTLRSRVPSIPRVVEDVIQKALAKDPQQRFPNIEAFAYSLEQACKVTPPLLDSLSGSTFVAAGLPLEAFLSGPSRRMPLGRSVVTIGRASDNQIVVGDSSVSGHHAFVRPEGQGYSIVDAGSMNGTFVNGQKLASNGARPLAQGDRIHIGSAVFTYEVNTASQSGTIFAGPAAMRNNQSPATVLAPSPASFVQPQPVQPQPPPTSSVQPPAISMYGGGSGPQAVPSSFGPQPTGQQPVILSAAGSPSPSTPLPSVVSGPGYTGPVSVSPPPFWRGKLIWIIASALLAVLLIGGGVFIYVNSLPTPAKTLKAYCDAIRSGDDNTAYSQLSHDFQRTTSQQMLHNLFSGVTSCSYDSLNQSGNGATARLTVVSLNTTSDDHITLVYDGGINSWKIDDDANLQAFVNLSLVKQTLETYCTSLQHGDYATVYGQFSGNLQQRITQQLFASFFPNVTGCTYSSPAVSGSTATTTLSITYHDSPSENDPVQLVRDATSGWKIDDIKNLSTLTKTLQAFCNGIASHTDQGFQIAYDQWSDGYKQQHTFDQFKTGYTENGGHGPVSACQVHDVSINGSSAGVGYIYYLLNDGQTGNAGYALIVDNGIWKMNQQY